ITFSTIIDSTSCKNASDGKIEFDGVTGGVTPYQFSIDNGASFQSDSVFSGLSAGSYDLIVKDDNGNDDSATVSVKEPNKVTFSTNIDSASCKDTCDGKIEFTSVSGGTSPYQYSKDNGASFQSGTTFSGLCDSTYNLIVKDDNGCDDSSTVEVKEPNELTFSTTIDSVSCFGGSDGQIDFSSVSGGTTPYQYSNDNGGSFQGSSTFSGLSAASYDLIVKDDNGCDDSATVSVEEPDSVSFTTSIDSVSCNGGNDGKITVSASGGTTPYQYSNDNGGSFQGSDIFNNLTAGNYDLIVKDDNGCDDSATVSVEEPNAISIDTGKTDASCNGVCDGKAEVTSVSGGTSPYSYSWDDPDFQTTDTADSLCE
ncbi:MAG: SprB repeat-containing protein, partial [Flavobacteriales bacterium]